VKRPVCFSAALLAHALLAMLVVRSELQKAPPPRHGGAAEVMVGRLITPAAQAPIAPIVRVVSKGTNPSAKCPKGLKSYSGIGVIYSWFEWQVLEVPRQFPAYQAGIRVGDLLLNVTPETKMTIGKPTLVRTSRNGVEIDYTITPLKVCYRDT
jgi:hypothetical protein